MSVKIVPFANLNLIEVDGTESKRKINQLKKQHELLQSLYDDAKSRMDHLSGIMKELHEQTTECLQKLHLDPNDPQSFAHLEDPPEPGYELMMIDEYAKLETDLLKYETEMQICRLLMLHYSSPSRLYFEDKSYLRLTHKPLFSPEDLAKIVYHFESEDNWLRKEQ